MLEKERKVINGDAFDELEDVVEKILLRGAVGDTENKSQKIKLFFHFFQFFKMETA